MINTSQADFDQPIILQRSPFWSRTIAWTMIGVTSFSVLWASMAQIDEAVSATGQMEPSGSVQNVQVPVNGVVKAVYVKEGQQVKRGDLLLRLDRTAEEAQMQALKTIHASLMAENAFYQSVMGETVATPANLSPTETVSPPPELAALTKSRAALTSENQLYRAQLAGSSQGTPLSSEQQLRLQSSFIERDSRQQVAQFEIEQLKQQLAQAKIQLQGATDILKVNQDIFQNMDAVARAGGVARVQYLRQQQEVTNGRARVGQLTQEVQRLELAISQSQQRLRNTISLSQQELLNKLAENEKKLADIDSQLKKAIVENQKKIAETDSQIKQSQVKLQYQEVRTPVDGTIFDLKAFSPGFVATSPEPILKVVPNDALLVKVFISNKDIGFVKPGMPVDVRVDTFPFSEFGDIKGAVISVGSDALPPTQTRPFYSFPVKVNLDRQTLRVRDQDVRLQSGMSVSVNIKSRQRSVLSLFTDSFLRQVDHLKSVR